MISLIVPVLNGMPWLPQALDSILEQVDPPPYELIVMDGGSTDGTREWLSDYFSGRMELVFAPDNGQADAVSRGFQRATGDILAWLNADDLYEPNALRTVACAFEEHPGAIAVSGGCKLVDGAGWETGLIHRLPDASLAGLLSTRVNLPQPATFFRRSAYEAVGGLDRRLEMAMDIDLWLRLAEMGQIVLIPDTLARFRIHPGAKTQMGSAFALREDFAIRRRHGLSIRSRVWWSFVKHAFIMPALGRR